MTAPVLRFPPLDAQPHLNARFIKRVPGIDVRTDRETALARLEAIHETTRREAGFGPLAAAEQVHGDRVSVAVAGATAPGTDALITDQPGLCLGIYVADCAALYVADRRGRAIGLAHSGKNGTALGILPRTIEAMRERYGIQPQDLTVVVSPCIRPPDYEIDFARDIARQAIALDVGEFHDCEQNTAAHPGEYYSYRREKGQTGRMLALLELRARK